VNAVQRPIVRTSAVTIFSLALLFFLSASYGAEDDCERQLGEDIRWVFLGFLFAVVLGDIASKFVRLFGDWDRTRAVSLARLSHLVLTLTVVLLSWIGWSLSVLHCVYPQPKLVFEVPTLFAFVDVVILTSYYALATGVDVHDAANGKLPSARHMLLWSMIIFIAYFLWDVLVAFVHPERDANFWQYGWVISLICSALASTAFGILRNHTPRHPPNAYFVYATDACLMSLFFAFRAVKQALYLLPKDHSAFQLWASVSTVLLLSFLFFLIRAWRI